MSNLIEQGNDTALIWRIVDPSGKEIDFSKFDRMSFFIQQSGMIKGSPVYPEFIIDVGIRFILKVEHQTLGTYDLVFYGDINGKRYKEVHEKAFRVVSDAASQHCVFDENNLVVINSCLSRFLDGRDGRSPYVDVDPQSPTFGYWYIFNDLSRTFENTGIRSDYSDLFATQVKKVTAKLEEADQAIAGQIRRVDAAMQSASEAISAVNTTNDAVIRNEIVREEKERSRVATENARAENERQRTTDENTRKANEEARQTNEQNRQTDTAAAIRNTNEAAAKAAEQGNTTQAQGVLAQTRGAHAANQGDAAERQGDIAEQQGRITEQQGVVAEQKGNEAAAKGNTAAQQGLAAEQKGNQAKLNGDYAREQGAAVAGEIVQLQQNLGEKLDISTFDMQNRKPTGLRFEPGNTSVFAKMTKALKLDKSDFTIVIYANAVGSQGWDMPVVGFSKKGGNNIGSFKYYSNNTTTGKNAIDAIIVDGKRLSGAVLRDTTDNVHTLILTRAGIKLEAFLNCRRLFEYTASSVTDFNDFLFDISCTQFFFGGSAFDYAMTHEESSRLLWNGGRYDEVITPSWMKIVGSVSADVTLMSKMSFVEKIGNIYTIGAFSGLNGHVLFKREQALSMNQVAITQTYKITLSGNISNDAEMIIGSGNLSTYIGSDLGLISAGDFSITAIYQTHPGDLGKTSILVGVGFKNPPPVGTVLRLDELKISIPNCLLEYRPENIRNDRVINTGIVGADGDLIFSPMPPEIMGEDPYKDKIMLAEKAAPDFHPIAIGQRCYSNNGSIYEAALPPVSRDWSVEDWKQINNA